MIDQAIVGLYLIITLLIGLYVGRNVKSIRDFAVGRKDFSTLVLVSAVFASVVDASCTVGLAGNTFSIGPILILAYTGVSVSRFILAYSISPKMEPFMDLISSGDIFERLYGTRAKTLMGISTLIECTLMTGSQVLAISHVLTYFFGISPKTAAIGGATVIIFYSFRGGIRSVTATDVFQFAIMLIAIPIVCGIGVAKMGGSAELWSFMKSKGLFIQKASLNDYGKQLAIFASMALPCLYPMCVQRMLMAKNTAQIKKAFLINGLLSLPFYAIAGLIGVVTLALMPHINPNFAFPVLIDEILPIGIKGFVIAGLLAIFMSTVDSILNVGSIAAAHDLVGSIVKRPLSERAELILVKVASIAIAVGAIFIALQFNNVLDVMFFVMVIGNSVFFPGYLFGIMTPHPDKKAFWIGVGVGALTVIFCFFILKMYPLYVMLIAIATNCSVHLIFRITRTRAPSNNNVDVAPTNESVLEIESFGNTLAYCWIRNLDYCKIFSACTLAISVLPFFILSNQSHNNALVIFLILNATTAVLSFFMLFHELWWRWVYRYLETLWIILLVLAFPMQSICMLVMESFSFPWLLDSLLAIPILITITRKIAPVLYGTGLVCVLIMFFSLDYTTSNLFDQFGFWSFSLHLVTLAICLFLFRKRDVELCQFASSILIHETGRSITTFETMAGYLQERLPILIDGYSHSYKNSGRKLTETELAFIRQIPKETLEACINAKSIAKSIALRIASLANRKSFRDVCSIKTCILDAINDPTLNDIQLKLEG